MEVETLDTFLPQDRKQAFDSPVDSCQDDTV